MEFLKRFITGFSWMWIWYSIFAISICIPNLVQGSEEDHDQTEDSSTVHSRQKRFVYFNTQSPVDIGLLITVPLSFALPTLNLKTSRRFRKSISEGNELAANLTAEDILKTDSYDEPEYTTELAKMTTYFTILEIEEDICQQKVICEVFADPEKFKPVSGIFERKLTVDRGTVGRGFPMPKQG